MSDEHSSELKFEEKIKFIEDQAMQKIESGLTQLKQDIDGRINHKLKHFSQGFSSQEKRIDKVASSILTAVDQKFIKDCDLKQLIFTKMEERMDVFDKELNIKSKELSDMISNKITIIKNEFNEMSKETKRSWKLMIEGVKSSGTSNAYFNSINLGSEKFQDLETKLRTDISDDIENIKSQINKLSIKCEKEISRFLNRQGVIEAINSSIWDYLSEYSKINDLKLLKNEFEKFKANIEQETANNAILANEIKDQIYNKVSSNIRKEWDLKIDNINETMNANRSKFEDRINKLESNVSDSLREYEENVNDNDMKITELKILVDSIKSKALNSNRLFNSNVQNHYTAELIQLSEEENKTNNDHLENIDNKTDENLNLSSNKEAKNIANQFDIQNLNFTLTKENVNNFNDDNSLNFLSPKRESIRGNKIEHLKLINSQMLTSKEEWEEDNITNIINESISFRKHWNVDDSSRNTKIKSTTLINKNNENSHYYPKADNDTFSYKESADDNLHIKSGIDESPYKSQYSINNIEWEIINETKTAEFLKNNISPKTNKDKITEFILEEEIINAITTFCEIRQTRLPDYDDISLNSFSINNSSGK